MPDDLAELCRSCGLCCDGSLFGRVPLEDDEVGIAQKYRLRVVTSGKGFEQPCIALSPCSPHSSRASHSSRSPPSSGEQASGPQRVCSIYDDRPRACRAFVCRLYERHRREGGPLAPRVAAAGRVRELVAELEALGLHRSDFEGDEGNSEGDAAPRPRAGAHAQRLHAELQKRLEDDFARA